MGEKTRKILVIHGPNLNLLGQRETSIYGDVTLQEINRELSSLAKDIGIDLDVFQSNHEGAIVDQIQQSDADAILINPAAYTHTSVAIRDALLAVGKPVVEVHLSNIFAREEFRQESFISDIALGVISGFGPLGYVMGLQALSLHLDE